MPVDDLGKLAFSKKLQQEWTDREVEVFGGTPYLGASIKHHDATNNFSSHYWGPDRRTFLSGGYRRRAFDGYLATGKARTPGYTGPIYVYLLRDGWTDLVIYIAAPERADLDKGQDD